MGSVNGKEKPKKTGKTENERMGRKTNEREKRVGSANGLKTWNTYKKTEGFSQKRKGITEKMGRFGRKRKNFRKVLEGKIFERF